MSYKEICDYININLKRTATEDEIKVLNCFWESIFPYRFLKKTNKKLFKKNLFNDIDLKKVKFKNHQLLIKSDKNPDMNNIGTCIKKVLSKGIIPEGVIINASDYNSFNNAGKYFHMSGIPVLVENLHRKEKMNGICTFSIGFSKKDFILKNKVSNGLNIIVIGEDTKITGNSSTNGFFQKKLIDFSEEVFNKKLVSAALSCEDGIFNSVLQFIKPKKWGIFINLNNLHKEEGDYQTWEYLTAKTPERMIFAVQNWKLVDFIKITDKYELPFSIIGKIDKSQSVKIVYKNIQTIYLNKKLIFNPLLKIENSSPTSYDKNYEFGENINSENIQTIISDSNFYNKSGDNLFNRYVGNKTDFILENSNIAELWYNKLKHYISVTTDSNNIQFDFNPYIAGQNCIFENARKLTAFGHIPVCFSINYYFDADSPNNVYIFNKFKEGVLFAAKKLRIKISNITFSNSTENGFSILMIGKKKKKQKLFVPYFENAQKVYLIGKPDNLPATSSYQKILNNKIYPFPDEVNLRFEKKLLRCIKQLQKESLISGIVPIGRFGIAKALIDGLHPKKLGFKYEDNSLNLNYIFNEIQSRFLISTNNNIIPILKKYKIPHLLLGKTKSPDYIELGEVKLDCNTFYGN